MIITKTINLLFLKHLIILSNQLKRSASYNLQDERRNQIKTWKFKKPVPKWADYSKITRREDWIPALAGKHLQNTLETRPGLKMEVKELWLTIVQNQSKQLNGEGKMGQLLKIKQLYWSLVVWVFLNEIPSSEQVSSTMASVVILALL